MIKEIVIYSDGTLISYDLSNCIIPSATGNWDLIPTLVDWMLKREPNIPDECQTSSLTKCFLATRTNEGEKRLEIPNLHFYKIASNAFKEEVDVLNNEIE